METYSLFLTLSVGLGFILFSCFVSFYKDTEEETSLGECKLRAVLKEEGEKITSKIPLVRRVIFDLEVESMTNPEISSN